MKFLSLQNLRGKTAVKSSAVSATTFRRMIAFVVLTFTLFFGAFAPSNASAETRTLKLYYIHTGEKAAITYKKNGKYLRSGLNKINQFLRDWRRNEPTKMDPKLLDLVWSVHRETGSKNYINVISAYRSPKTNKMLRRRGRGVAKRSQHTRGKAMDFFIPGVSLAKLRAIGLRKGIGGVGYYPRSGSPFVHMDTGKIRHWPRMNRKQLVRVFPKGRTLHVPSDGKPLKGYKIALARYKKGGYDKILYASEKKKGFFARIFGGGKDEEEDNEIQSTTPRAVRTRKVRQNTRPTGKKVEPPKPAEPAINPVLVARLPDLDRIPIPRFAERETLDETTDSETQIAVVVPSQKPESDDPVVDQIEVALAAKQSDDGGTNLLETISAATKGDRVYQPKQAELALGKRIEKNENGVSAITQLLRPGIDAGVNSEGLTQVASLPDPNSANQTGFVAPTPRQNPRAGTESAISNIIKDSGTDTDINNDSSVVVSLRDSQVSEDPLLDLQKTARIPMPKIRPEVAQAEIASLAPAVPNTTIAERQSVSMQIGNLSGDAVTNWALSTTTRIGDVSVIRAPAYGQSTLHQLPSHVIVNGFTKGTAAIPASQFSKTTLQSITFARLK